MKNFKSVILDSENRVNHFPDAGTPIDLKICRRCQKHFPITEFHTRGKYRHCDCRWCVSTLMALSAMPHHDSHAQEMKTKSKIPPKPIDDPPTYTPLVLLQSSWRRIRKPSRKTILNLHGVPNTREESVGAYLSGLPGKAPCKSSLR